MSRQHGLFLFHSICNSYQVYFVDYGGMKQDRILITGAGGQIGQVLGQALQDQYGPANVLATDLKPVPNFANFEILDVLDVGQFTTLIQRFRPTVLYHLAGILSAVGEKNPDKAWSVNTQGWINAVGLASRNNVSRVFFPSSIAVFGPGSPLEQTGQNVPLHPSTVYGITKMAGEGIGEYFFRKHHLDVRGLRYPGIISYQTDPGGGTTDYAVDIFHQLLVSGEYTCFLDADRVLPMMYIDDAIQGTLQLMEADPENIRIRTAYNFGAMSFSPRELAEEIRLYLPEMKVNYEPDFRNEIALNWPQEILDVEARRDWNWQPKYGITETVREMIGHLKERKLPT